MKLDENYEQLLSFVLDTDHRQQFRLGLKRHFTRLNQQKSFLYHENEWLKNGELSYPPHTPDGYLTIKDSETVSSCRGYKDCLLGKEDAELKIAFISERIDDDIKEITEYIKCELSTLENKFAQQETH